MRLPIVLPAALVAPVLIATTTGCGGVYYAITASAAESRLEEARQIGAEAYAAYEYTYSKRHLQQAAVEASEASYSDASELAEVAEQFAIRAIEVTRTRRGMNAAPKERDIENLGGEIEEEPTDKGTTKKETKP